MNTANLPNRPIVWTIAGSDSSGGAGIQADLKAMNALGVYGCSVITSLTAQNTQRVAQIEHASPGMIEAQLFTLQADLPPVAIKIGMLGSATAVKIVSEFLKTTDAFVICDPILTATRGGNLLELDGVSLLKAELFPHVDLLTPNIPETETLLARKMDSLEEIEQAAHELLAMGVKSVLIKGGHGEGDYCEDYWTNGKECAWLSSPRLRVAHTHGGGCTLSAAIAASRGLGFAELDAIVIAKAYTNHGLRRGGGIGKGRGPLAHEGWPNTPEDLPLLTIKTPDHGAKLDFAPMDERKIGLYPIVDRSAWLEKLLPLGIKTIQLRIKDLTDAELETEIKTGIAIAKRLNARLFINDHWQLALRHGAYGVHLGQDDLSSADFGALSKAGLRLGISTHSYAEMARAMVFSPSYIAIGTIFESPSKTFKHVPLGLEAFARMRKLLSVPVVAIGGITLEKAPEVIAAGADGIAVISDIAKAPDIPARIAQWMELLPKTNLPG